MADFKVKNGLQAKRYLQTTTALASTATAIDLSKGNNFSITPSGNPTFTFTNPPATGKAQAFSVEVTGGSNGMDEIFNTTLYTTDGTSSKTITTGMDLSSNEGLVWLKRRSGSYSHSLFDTVRGVQKQLQSDATTAESTETGGLTAFNSNGFTIGNVQNQSVLGNMVAWTWKSTANFFDVVTYTGDGTDARQVSHNLGSSPGMIIVKRYGDSGYQWVTYHRSLSDGEYLTLDSSDAATNPGSNTMFGTNAQQTSTYFTLGSNANKGFYNQSGKSYVAYLFAHNSSTVSCGSYTGNGSATGPTVDVGFQPQWLLFKLASGSGENWIILDSERGITTDGTDARLEANTADAESNSANYINLTSTGFQVTSTSNNMNTNNQTYIYVAIAAGGAGSLTWPTSVKYTGGTAPSSPALGKKDVFTFMTVDGGTSYVGKKAVEGLS